MAVKSFSPSLATAALPLVSRIVSEAGELETALAGLGETYRAQKASADPKEAELNDTRRAMTRIAAERDACIAELADLGAVADELGAGFVDFPGELDGGPVLFCWRVGEERVDHVHGADETSADRRPLPVPCDVA